MRLATLLPLLIALPTSAADSGPAQLAAPWLERAAAELPNVRAEDAASKEPPRGWEMLVAEDAQAIMLFECRPDASNRARLLEIARRFEQAKAADDKPETRLMWAFRPALLYAHAGAVDDARRFYPAIDKAATELNDGEAMPASTHATLVRTPTADFPDEYVAQMPSFSFGPTIRTLADAGKAAPVARLTAAALTKVEPATPENRTARELLARYLAESRQLDAARRLATGMEADRFFGARTFAEIAQACHAAGEPAAGVVNFKDAVAAATALRSDSERAAAFHAILRHAVDAGDPGSCSAVAAALAPLLEAKPFYDDSETRCLLARAFLVAGRRAEFDRHAAKAEEKASLSDMHRRSTRWIAVATTYAGARDQDRVNAAVDKADAAARENPPLDPHEWVPLVEAHARAGNFDAALEVVRSRIPKAPDRWSPLFPIAHQQALAGQYAAAERTANEFEQPFFRFFALRRIVVERIRTNRTDGLLEWISANPSPRQRAALHLAAAQQILGKEGKGTTRILTGPL